jgi:hypothetical protein
VQFLSIELKSIDVEVADGADTVTVLVAMALPAFTAASFDNASFARLASTPVPAASPITAADSNAMITERMKTNNEQPRMVPFLCLPGSECAPP